MPSPGANGICYGRFARVVDCAGVTVVIRFRPPPKARFFGAPPRFFAQEQRNGVERAAGGRDFCPRKRRTRTSPQTPTSPLKKSGEDDPRPPRQKRSREWWRYQGKKSAFLWRLDTVSLGKHQRNGVEWQSGAEITKNIKAQTYKAKNKRGKPLDRVSPLDPLPDLYEASGEFRALRSAARGFASGLHHL